MDELLCGHCGEDFARKDSLARHKRRKYPCDMDGNAPASDYSKCHSEQIYNQEDHAANTKRYDKLNKKKKVSET